LPSSLDYLSIQHAVRASRHQLNGFVLIVVGMLAAPDGFHVSVNDGSRAFVLGVSEAVQRMDGEETDKQWREPAPRARGS
jgi:hypothetical protein